MGSKSATKKSSPLVITTIQPPLELMMMMIPGRFVCMSVHNARCVFFCWGCCCRCSPSSTITTCPLKLLRLNQPYGERGRSLMILLINLHLLMNNTRRRFMSHFEPRMCDMSYLWLSKGRWETRDKAGWLASTVYAMITECAFTTQRGALLQLRIRPYITLYIVL